MEKHLIISLNDKQQLISDINLCHSYQVKNPYSEVTFLTFEDFKDITEFAPVNFNFIYINQNKIKTILNSRLFSDAFAINEFQDNLQPILERTWDRSIEITGNGLAAYIHTILDAKIKVGATLSDRNFVRYSNSWTQVLNDFINPTEKHYVSHSIKNQIQLEVSQSHIVPYQVSNDLVDVSNRNFKRIREKIGADVSIIAYNISEFRNNFELLCESINKHYNSFEYFPIIIYSATEENIDLVNKVNPVFNDSLICVKYEYSALPAILINTDLIITKDKVTKFIADGCETPSIFLTDNINKFDSLSLFDGSCLIEATELKETVDSIYGLTNMILNPMLEAGQINNQYIMPETHNSESTLNFKIKDTNITNFLSTFYILNKYENSITEFNLTTADTSLSTIIKSEKEMIHEIIKHLLTSIRLTKTGLSKEADLNKFIQTLDTLFSFSHNQSSTSVAVSIFKSNIERIEEQDPSINIKLIESFLYELKNDFKLLISSFDKLQKTKGETAQQQAHL